MWIVRGDAVLHDDPLHHSHYDVVGDVLWIVHLHYRILCELASSSHLLMAVSQGVSQGVFQRVFQGVSQRVSEFLLEHHRCHKLQIIDNQEHISCDILQFRKSLLSDMKDKQD